MSSRSQVQTTDAACLGGRAGRSGEGARAGGRLDFRGAAGYCRAVPRAKVPILAGLRFSLIGPGKVGTSLAAWAMAAGAELVGRCASATLDERASEGQDLLLVA